MTRQQNYKPKNIYTSQVMAKLYRFIVYPSQQLIVQSNISPLDVKDSIQSP
jgi:hypothetical protein